MSIDTTGTQQMPCYLSLVLATLFAVAATPCQEAVVESAITEAEAEATAGRNEGAALRLRDASSGLRTINEHSLRQELDARIQTLRSKVDTHWSRASTTARDAARKMVAAAALYEAKGWLRTAQGYLEQAERILPLSAAEPMAKLRTARAAAVAADPARGDGFMAWFADGDDVGHSSGSAALGQEVVMAELHESREALFLSSHRALPGSIHFRARVKGITGGAVCLVFGYRHYDDYHRAGFQRDGEHMWIDVYHHLGSRNIKVAQRSVPLPQSFLDVKEGEHEPLLAVSVTVERKKVHVTVDGGSLEVELKEPLPIGFLGLKAWQVGKSKFRPSFQDLVIIAEKK